MQYFAPLKLSFVAIAILAVGSWAGGCAGELDPSLVPTGAGGTVGTAGTTGTGGTSGPPCDAVTMLLANTAKCATAGACHGSSGTQGIDFTAAGLVGRLVGKMPAATSPSCSTSAMPYLVANSDPASGLLLDKMKAAPSCGLTMPFGGLGGPVTPAEMTCLADWATAAATGRIQ